MKADNQFGICLQVLFKSSFLTYYNFEFHMKVYFHQEKIKTIHLVNTRAIDSDGQMSFYGVFIFSVFSMPFKVISIGNNIHEKLNYNNKF